MRCKQIWEWGVGLISKWDRFGIDLGSIWDRFSIRDLTEANREWDWFQDGIDYNLRMRSGIDFKMGSIWDRVGIDFLSEIWLKTSENGIDVLVGSIINLRSVPPIAISKLTQLSHNLLW